MLGVNSESSLPIIPKSHNWKESDTKRTKLNPIIDGIKFINHKKMAPFAFGIFSP